MELIADIGGTHSRCALIDDKGRLIATEVFENRDFDGVNAVLDHYLSRRRLSDRPREAALAIAGPMVGDRVELTNLPWQFSRKKLADALDLKRLIVVNDFAAVAWALPLLTAKDLEKVGGGDAVPREPLVVLGPGSGLGVALSVPVEGSWLVVAGEGGHAGIAPVTPRESAVVDALRDSGGYCAAETLLSGPGLARIHGVLTELAGENLQALTPAGISAAAARGEPIAIEAREMFFALLGSLAGDLALTAGARGGVYIAGGIVPKLLKAFTASRFRSRFEAKGRYHSYLASVPTFVITAPTPALTGLRKLLGHR